MGTPLRVTVVAPSRLVPVTVMSVPTSPLAGVKLTSVGAGVSTVKSRLAERPPPGAGFSTVTASVPAVVKAVAGIVAVSCVADWKVVDRGVPLNRTTELLT
jgi:hypothetical protein